MAQFWAEEDAIGTFQSAALLIVHFEFALDDTPDTDLPSLCARDGNDLPRSEMCTISEEQYLSNQIVNKHSIVYFEIH